MTDYDDLEERWLSRLNRLSDVLEDNAHLLIAGALLAVFGIWSGHLDPDWPAWWPIIPIMLVTALIVGYLASDKIAALIPDEDGIILVSLAANREGGQIWEISEDDWGDMAVSGTLYEWSETPRRVYECRQYLPDDNHAIANWREAEPASSIMAEHTVEDAIEQVSELREVYEPEAARARRLQRRIRGIVRVLDRERSGEFLEQAEQKEGLDAIEGTSISDILDQELPDDLHPEAGRGEGNEEMKTAPDPKGAIFGGFGGPDRIDVEQDAEEAIEPSDDQQGVWI